MVLSKLISLFLYLVVGSLVIFLYVVSFSSSSAFFSQSSLFITTKATPLSTVSTILMSSLLNCAIAFCASFVIFCLGVGILQDDLDFPPQLFHLTLFYFLVNFVYGGNTLYVRGSSRCNNKVWPMGQQFGCSLCQWLTSSYPEEAHSSGPKACLSPKLFILLLRKLLDTSKQTE